MGKQGFGSMDPEKHRELARKGGQTAHARGTAHVWDAAAAKEAGRKGGIASRGGRGKAVMVPVAPAVEA